VKKFEYNILRSDTMASCEELDHLGQHGWDLINIMLVPGVYPEYVYTFKRRLEEAK